MLKTSSQPASTLPTTNIDNSKVIGSSARNGRKSVKSDFTKPMRRAEEPSFLTPKARQAFSQLRQAFTKVTILQLFDPKCYV